MRQTSPAKKLFHNSLLAILYAAAFSLSLNIHHPYDYLNDGTGSNSAFKQQAICLIPINEQDNKPTNNPVNVLPIALFKVSSLLNSYNFDNPESSSLLSDFGNATFYTQKASIVVLRRLRI
ncbi:MAG: hypothetical protein HGA37_07850 [Lentimicrobium sp.]|nr:hypothetical protein [Lentimicrobium sp.]